MLPVRRLGELERAMRDVAEAMDARLLVDSSARGPTSADSSPAGWRRCRSIWKKAILRVHKAQRARHVLARLRR